MINTRPGSERALLIGVQIHGHRALWRIQDSLSELTDLARSAGARVVRTVSQNLEKPSSTYVGLGKLDELRDIIESERIDVVICDDELQPAQQRNLEEAFRNNTKVIDRTALILDVFAHRALTREGKLQVELAQHEYLLPRLAGQWSHLERLGGGIGTRGPGESQLETDRRLVRRRIQKIKHELESVRRHRSLYRAKRREQGLAVASLVGYTNAGKSTLMNALTGAGVAAEDRLFTTLDPVTRKARLPSGKDLLLTDTVGFIQKLPTTVIAAFRATLEEASESSIIVHVVDISHPNASEQAEVVQEILAELGLERKPRLLVLNKIDLLTSSLDLEKLKLFEDSGDVDAGVVFTSAITGRGISDFLSAADKLLDVPQVIPAVITIN